MLLTITVWELQTDNFYHSSSSFHRCLKLLWRVWCRGGHSHYGGDTDVRLQRPPIFSATVTQWPHIFAHCPCCHPKTPHFLVKCGLFDHSHPKTPYFFCIWLQQEATFCFNFIDKLIIFAIFDDFVQIPAFKAFTERSKVTFLPNTP